MQHLHHLWSEQRTFLLALVKGSFLGGLVGVLAGISSAAFLLALDWATQTRVANPWLLYLLPFAGFGVGWVYHHYAGAARRGSSLVVEAANQERGVIPRRMAPLIFFGSVITHLFGGSAGREGAAVQMATSLADGLRRILGVRGDDHRQMILAGISGGFGAVFGTPLAGIIFALEVQSVGRIRYDSLIPCFVAALVGDLVTRGLGIGHTHYPRMAEVGIDAPLLLRVGLAGIVFGLASLLFIELTERLRHLVRRHISYPPLAPVIGGCAVIALALLFGTDYLGLSLPLISRSVGGDGVEAGAFLLKIIFTAVTLSTGFMGGEVTPLFVIGATLGYALGGALGVEPHFLAMLGFVAVFAGASNTPLACTLMGVELFGGGGVLYLALACFAAYLASGHRGIYSTQRLLTPKLSRVDLAPDTTLDSYRTPPRR
ncbi:MAG: chloride channel protein [Anaerolineae bacterium]|nr:chloride channel protein [Anaerolineae bacterium]